MASSDPMVDGPPTKKAKIGGDANGKYPISEFFILYFSLFNFGEADFEA